VLVGSVLVDMALDVLALVVRKLVRSGGGVLMGVALDVVVLGEVLCPSPDPTQNFLLSNLRN
jgi:hypothetical protein